MGIAEWLKVGGHKRKRHVASPEAERAWVSWHKDPSKHGMEEYRKLMHEVTNPVDKAIYLRLFRKARNLRNA